MIHVVSSSSNARPVVSRAFTTSNRHSISKRTLSNLKQTRGGGILAGVLERETKSTTAQTSKNPLDYNAATADAGSLSMEELWKKLETSPEAGGLTTDQALARLQQYG